MKKLPEKMEAARAGLVRKLDYTANGVWFMIPVPKPGLGTMAVDQYWRLYYDPEAINRWSTPELAGVLLHELAHLWLKHHERGRGKERVRWNFATDLAINSRFPLPLPEGALRPETFGFPEGLTAEEYYELLKDNPKFQEMAQAVQEGNTPAPAAGRCGSAATGVPEPWEDPAPEEGGPPGVSEAHAEAIRRAMAQAARNRGDLPGELSRFVEELLSPKVDWRKALASAIRNAVARTTGAVDYTYRRPSRRQPPGVILPSLYRPAPEVAVVVDTSGSISDEELAQALGEIKGIVQGVGGREIAVLAVDAEVHGVFRTTDPRKVSLKGGGGTDLRVGFERAQKLHPKPQVLVVLTDGYTPWPELPPKGMKVIVGLFGEGGEPPPSWAETVQIRD